MGIASVLLIVVSISIAVITQACAAGRIGVNSVAGIRTRRVMVSPEAWRIGHRAALFPTWIGAGVSAVLAALSFIGFSIWTQLGLLVASGLVLVVTGFIAVVLANRAAENESAVSR